MTHPAASVLCPTCKDGDCVESVRIDNCTACGWFQHVPLDLKEASPQNAVKDPHHICGDVTHKIGCDHDLKPPIFNQVEKISKLIDEVRPPSDKCSCGLCMDCQDKGRDVMSKKSETCNIGCAHPEHQTPSPRAEFGAETEYYIRHLRRGYEELAPMSRIDFDGLELDLRSLVRLALRGVGR